MNLAEELMYTCYQLYRCMPTGLAPDMVEFQNAALHGLAADDAADNTVLVRQFLLQCVLIVLCFQEPRAGVAMRASGERAPSCSPGRRLQRMNLPQSPLPLRRKLATGTSA